MPDDKNPGAVTLEQARKAILELVSQGEDAHWRIGTWYNTIVGQKLAEANGYKSAADYIAKELRQIAEPTLRLYGRVAKNFTEDNALKYGVSKLGLLHTYLVATGAPFPAGDAGGVVVRVPQQDGKPVDTKFSDCSFSEMSGALKFLRPAPEGLPEDSVETFKLLEAELAKHGAHILVEGKVHGSTVWVNLSHIPIELLWELAEALQIAVSRGGPKLAPPTPPASR